MGNKNSVKSSKKKNFCCCLSSSTYSIDEKSSFPTFDRLSINIKKKFPQPTLFYSESNENLSLDLLIKSNYELINLINKYQLKFYLNDYLNRIKHSKNHQIFQKHFLSSTIIHPYHGLNQDLIENLKIFFISPSESILPNLFINKNNKYNLHEQIRSKCYFIPLENYQIEPYDDEYQQKLLSNNFSTLDNNQIKENSIELQSSYLFISNDNFQTGLIRVDNEKISKELLPFIFHCLEKNFYYLSSNLIEKWFKILIIVNQTCSIVNRFLTNDKNHITCLFQKQIINQENSNSLNNNNLIFASLRLPFSEEKSEKIIDAFSPVFLSDNKKFSNNYIHIDYEEYSFAFILSRWPKILIENYYTHSYRYSIRKWPSEDQMKIILNKSLLLIPDSTINNWKINFDLIEKYLFELMNELTLFFYILCQQLFSQTYSQRLLIKHCFLNYCEKYGLLSFKKLNLIDLINDFLNDLLEQINKNFLPNYFNYQINLLNSNENYNQWFDYIKKCLNDRIYLFSSTFVNLSNRSIHIEYLFYFTDQLYQTFRRQESKFYLNEKILLDLHRKICENYSNKKFLLDKQIIENIQKNFIMDFEFNAELVHSCLNQIRKSQSSLIFHYIWTIFIQYLHTYYNVLWNIE